MEDKGIIICSRFSSLNQVEKILKVEHQSLNKFTSTDQSYKHHIMGVFESEVL